MKYLSPKTLLKMVNEVNINYININMRVDVKEDKENFILKFTSIHLSSFEKNWLKISKTNYETFSNIEWLKKCINDYFFKIKLKIVMNRDIKAKEEAKKLKNRILKHKNKV